MLVAALLATALGLRLWGLGLQSLWYDELFSLVHARMAPGAMLHALAVDGTNLPAYPLFLKGWIALFGSSEWALRLPSALLGAASVYLTWRLGQRIFTTQAGWIAALFVTVSALHIYYAQEARMYTLMVVLMALSVLWLLDWLEKGDRRAAIGYVAVTAVLLYTHYYGLFLVVVQNLYVALCWLYRPPRARPDMRLWIGGQFVLGVLFAPWVWLWFENKGSLANANWMVAPTFATIRNVFRQFANGPLLLVLSVFALIAGALNGAFTKTERGRGSAPSGSAGRRFFPSFSAHPHFYLAVLWLVGLVALPVAVSYAYRPIFDTRYVLGASLPFYLLVGGALSVGRRRRFIGAAAAALIVGASIPGLVKIHQPGLKPEWREVVAVIENEAAPGDLVLIVGGYHQVVYAYYAKRSDLVVKGRGRLPPRVGAVRQRRLDRNIQALTAGFARVWLIAHKGEDGQGTLQAILSRHYTLKKDRAFSLLRLSAFER